MLWEIFKILHHCAYNCARSGTAFVNPGTRSALGLTFELIDLALHRGDLLLFLCNLELESLLGFRRT